MSVKRSILFGIALVVLVSAGAEYFYFEWTPFTQDLKRVIVGKFVRGIYYFTFRRMLLDIWVND